MFCKDSIYVSCHSSSELWSSADSADAADSAWDGLVHPVLRYANAMEKAAMLDEKLVTEKQYADPVGGGPPALQGSACGSEKRPEQCAVHVDLVRRLRSQPVSSPSPFCRQVVNLIRSAGRA